MRLSKTRRTPDNEISFGIMKGERVMDPGKLYQIRAFKKYQSIALATGATCFACTYFALIQQKRVSFEKLTL
jgi:hypothetical protein